MDVWKYYQRPWRIVHSPEEVRNEQPSRGAPRDRRSILSEHNDPSERVLLPLIPALFGLRAGRQRPVQSHGAIFVLVRASVPVEERPGRGFLN